MAKGIRRLLDIAINNIRNDIQKYIANSQNNRFARWLSGEGYNGGYRDALYDVQLALSGIVPSRNGWWEKQDSENEQEGECKSI